MLLAIVNRRHFFIKPTKLFLSWVSLFSLFLMKLIFTKSILLANQENYYKKDHVFSAQNLKQINLGFSHFTSSTAI